MKVTEITIEGRQFKPIKNGTFAHDIWITSKVRAAGLSNVTIADGETQDDFIERLAVEAWNSGFLLEIMGALLIPADKEAKDWTPELGKKTAEFFGNVTDEESKTQLRMTAGGVLYYFFVKGLSSSATSMKSGIQMAKDEGEPRATEAAPTTATGAT